jgi:RecA/RadA recombinase
MAEKKKLSIAERVAASIRKVSPRKGDAGMIEVSLSQECVLSDVKYVITTGLRPFDRFVGGLPVGRIVEYFGLEACGKTALCKLSARRAQLGFVYKRTRLPDGHYQYDQLDPATYDITVLYIDNEGSLDEGTVPANWVVCRAETVELMFKTIDRTIETLKEVQETEKKIQFLLVVCDTIAGTNSKEELAQEWGKDDYARQPKQLREGFRNMVQEFSRWNVCMVCTNQVSDKIGYVSPKYGAGSMPTNTPNPDKYSSSGGLALKFWASSRVFMYQVPTKYVLVKGAKFDAGYLIEFVAVKNRLAKPKRRGRLVLLFDDDPNKGGFRDDFSVLETLKSLKIAEEDSEGEIVFKFRKNGIIPTTFDSTGKTLEEQDAAEGKGRNKDPRVSSRAAWPHFYEQHRADFDALWEKAVEYVFTVEGIDGEPTAAVEEDEDEDLKEPETIVPKNRAGRARGHMALNTMPDVEA